jgi:hypothetical protein
MKLYQTPDMEWIRLGAEDILRTSDNDADFVAPDNGDDGFSGYH